MRGCRQWVGLQFVQLYRPCRRICIQNSGDNWETALLPLRQSEGSRPAAWLGVPNRHGAARSILYYR